MALIIFNNFVAWLSCLTVCFCDSSLNCTYYTKIHSFQFCVFFSSTNCWFCLELQQFGLLWTCSLHTMAGSCCPKSLFICFYWFWALKFEMFWIPWIGPAILILVLMRNNSVLVLVCIKNKWSNMIPFENFMGHGVLFCSFYCVRNNEVILDTQMLPPDLLKGNVYWMVPGVKVIPLTTSFLAQSTLLSLAIFSGILGRKINIS